MLHEDFIDYKVKDIRVIGAKKGSLEVNDLVVDRFGTMGRVEYISEKYGPMIEFVDGSATYETKEMKLRKTSSSNTTLFDYYKRYFGKITELAKIIKESISSEFPHVHMFNDGNIVYVRGSTLKSIVTRHTHAKITDSHSFFAARLTPFYNCEIEQFSIKKSKRKSQYGWLLLRNLFIDIDLDMHQSQRMKFTVNDSNEYNVKKWVRIVKQFKKFRIKYSVL